LSYDIKLLELLNNQLELDLKMIMSNYIPFIHKLVFNELSVGYTKEDIEKYLNDIFLEVLAYKDGINSQSNFNKVLSEIIARRKVIDMHRRIKNNNKILIDDVSVDLHTISYDIIHSIFLKESNSQLIDGIKSLDESYSEAITRKYSLNQRLRDISKNTGLKVSAYA
jgi:RNA polymerase sigma-70 factor (ECF subfamily)